MGFVVPKIGSVGGICAVGYGTARNGGAAFGLGGKKAERPRENGARSSERNWPSKAFLNDNVSLEGNN